MNFFIKNLFSKTTWKEEEAGKILKLYLDENRRWYLIRQIIISMMRQLEYISSILGNTGEKMLSELKPFQSDTTNFSRSEFCEIYRLVKAHNFIALNERYDISEFKNLTREETGSIYDIVNVRRRNIMNDVYYIQQYLKNKDYDSIISLYGGNKIDVHRSSIFNNNGLIDIELYSISNLENHINFINAFLKL